MSLPSPASPTPADKHGAPPRRPRGGRLLLVLFFAALVGPCVYRQAPREIARWQLARALQLREAGEKDRASELLAAALARLPDSPELLMQRAAWRLEDGQPDDALADANRAVELTSGNVQLLIYRSHVLQRLGRHKEAVEDWKQIDRTSEMSGVPPRAMALNGLAYAQALGQLELDDALQNASKATQLEPGSGAIRDTRGYLLYLKQAYPAALEEMNLAVRRMEAETAAAKRDPQPVVGPQFADLADLDRGVAVVRYHRALVLLALGREEEAEEDVDRVRELIGGEPDESLF